MVTRKHFRDLREVWIDLLWPGAGMNEPDPLESMRHKALAEVLQSLPDEDYGKLKESFDQFEWFIPDVQVRGMNLPFWATVFPEEEVAGPQPSPHAHVIYLSPTLERSVESIVLAVVAHEVAHFVLGHALSNTFQEYEAEEDAVFRLICDGGLNVKRRSIELQEDGAIIMRKDCCAACKLWVGQARRARQSVDF